VNHATDLNRPSLDDVEDEVTVDDQDTVPEVSETVVVRLPAGPRESGEPIDDALETIDECVRRGGPIPRDVVQDVEEVAFRDRQVLESVAGTHPRRARSFRIIAP